MYVGFLKGATAYEFQVGSYGMRIVHLKNGGRFTWWAHWRRISFHHWENR